MSCTWSGTSYAVRDHFYIYILFILKKYIESYNHLDILCEARDINYGPRLKSLF